MGRWSGGFIGVIYIFDFCNLNYLLLMKRQFTPTICTILCFTIYCMIGALLLQSCEDKPITTKWSGYLTQEDLFAYAHEYKSTMTMTIKGKKVTGENYVAAIPNDSMFARLTFEGIVDGDTIRLFENRIIEAAKKKGEWYTKDHVMYYKNSTKTELGGRWQSQRNHDAVGQIHFKLIP